MKQFTYLLIIFSLAFSACAQQLPSTVKAENQKNSNYTTEIVVPNLNIPWGMVFLPDGSMLITEKFGELIHFKNDKKNHY